MIRLANPDFHLADGKLLPIHRAEHEIRADAGNGFEVAPLELARKCELLSRVDRKFVTSLDRARHFLRGIRRDYCILLAGGSGWARYETCYFDTPDLLTFHEHVRGRRPRDKVRIRHHVDRQRSFLEIKSKTNAGKTFKERRDRHFGDSLLTDDDRRFIAERCSLPSESLEASVWTNFHRATFLGIHTKERITVDIGLTFRRDGATEEHLEFGIIELKQSRFMNSTTAARTLRELSVREQSLSKYCAGVAKVHDAAKPRARLTVARTLQRMKT